MATEFYTVIALPYSKAADATFHVSLFVSPALTPDGGEEPLKTFSLFPHWATLLTSGAAEFELSDQAGVIDAEPILKEIDPPTWDAAFPPDTPVRAPSGPEWDNRYWRTFRAAEVHNAGKLLHLAAMYVAPTSPPAPSLHPLAPLMRRLSGGSDNVKWDETQLTRSFDAQLGETGVPGEPGLSLDQVEKVIAGQQDPFSKLTLELHRARRFYERPESALPYQDRPDLNPVVEKLPRPEPDFHERVSLASDHQSLQRRLGLVIDLIVHDPSRLAKSEWLSGRIIIDGSARACRTTRVRCMAVGDDLLTVPKTEDWHHGALRLGDDARFDVLDMDPDGTALKLDRYLWSFPRLLKVEDNGDPIHAAPTALRSVGFTVVRNQKALATQQRIASQTALGNQLELRQVPELATEDVTQGMRVDVFDETAGGWFTLHARRIDVEVDEHGPVVKDLAEEGFIQGTTATETVDVEDSPVHVHEAMFGWDGWSLAAPRPGKRVRHENGDEIVEDPKVNPDHVTPIVIENRVEPGTLPRLRYGRSYAFRVWGVDLAGNSRPRDLGSAPAGPEAEAAAAAAPAATAPSSDLVGTVRGETAAAVVRRRAGRAERRPLLFERAEAAKLPDDVLGRLRARRPEGPGPMRAADRAAAVERAFADVVLDDSHPFLVSTARRDSAALADLIATAGTPAPADLVDVVSPLRPFLRWDPVQPPAVVARRPFTAGESLRHVVVRSGVTQDRETLEITVTPPEPYAIANPGFEYRATSERHLAPPKTSQIEAELYGAFDRAIGSKNQSRHDAMLAVAVREAGTWFDMDVPRLDDPNVRDLQPGIALENDPGVPGSALKQLPLAPGEAPAAGQYVVHNVDEPVVPYLADLAARGISVVFPEAGLDRFILFPFGVEGFTATYRGRWPERRPFRLVLEGAGELGGRLQGTALRIALPPGDVQRFRLASSLDANDLDRFGLWRILPPVLRENPDVIEAAADGWLWALTPFDDVTLVHAVPRPLEAPRPTELAVTRAGAGSTDAWFWGAVDVHGPSTEQLTAEARWVDPIDDLGSDGPSEISTRAVAFTTRIRPSEDLSLLFGPFPDDEVDVENFGPVWTHQAVHPIGDTRHHTITYRFRASTRFREYFDPATLAPGAPLEGLPDDDGQSVVGPEIERSVPSSARPAAPIVHSVIPLFRWEEATEPEQPVAVRRGRRAGVRIYLERPWYSSGEGELLGVLIGPGGDDGTVDGKVSQWGADPAWVSASVDKRAMFMELDNLMRATGLDDRPGDARPVVAPTNRILPDGSTVTVLGYQPQYNATRKLWYVDVAIDPGSTFWPFVRLALARYQPDSIGSLHLSPQVLCDYVQLTPERTTSVSRTDVRHIRVVVSGPVGIRTVVKGGPLESYADSISANRLVVARLQRQDPDIPTDLGWETVDVVELEVKGTGRDPETGAIDLAQAAWVGILEAPRTIPLRRPGSLPNWRVTVEEWERLPGDPANLGSIGLVPPPPVWEQRLIYADEIGL
ncbi:MAG: hypothetical protein OEM84_12800 [Acidimicrobiia bacterium]|nr:hypothetical protein [Acidimicrobiia bacterium]